MSGSSISISWSTVEEASSYDVDVKPAPSMTNELSVSSNYAFIDGLKADVEYTIRVAARIHGSLTSYSTPLKVTPSGAPIIAPAPHVISYDETSVTLGRHHMRHYRNGNDMKKVIVAIQEQGGEMKEMEFIVAIVPAPHP